jgi:hypothetical protein
LKTLIVEVVGQEQEHEEGAEARDERRQKRGSAPNATESRRSTGTAMDLVGKEEEKEHTDRSITNFYDSLHFS